MNPPASSVIKVGGSLLGYEELPTRLKGFLADFTRPRPILVCGGGDAVELIREWDRLYTLGEEASHWISLRLLSATAQVLAAMLPEKLEVVESPAACVASWERGLVPVYDPYRFIVDIDERSPDPLPRRWRVTTDTIAARIAERFGASELVLLKSSSRPETLTMAEAADEGFVDGHFPFAARNLERVVALNLRRPEDPETVLVPPDPAAVDPHGSELDETSAELPLPPDD
ncbi:MAG TPA: uridylate kinase [Planctomycetota bacterium]|nr:uridylate kinase [Planctomycetota bacterium]